MVVIFGMAPAPMIPVIQTISAIDVQPELLAEIFYMVLPPVQGHNEPLILPLMINGKRGIMMLVDEGSSIDSLFLATYH